MKKIFITGSEGFIGSHLIEQLVRDGYSVKAGVQYNSFNQIGWLEDISPELRNEIAIVLCDVRDLASMNKHVAGSDVVMHLAALVGIPYSYEAPRSYIDTNIIGTYNVAKACLENNVGQLIHTSTSEVYGSAEYTPIDEKHPIRAQSPYAATKIAADQLVLSFYASFELPVSILRPFNAYGPRQSKRAVIPTMIHQFLDHSRKSLNLGSVTTVRDFSYVKDTVRGFVAAIDCKESLGEIINIGSGYAVRIDEIVNLLNKITGRNLEVSLDLSRLRPEKSEVTLLHAGNEKSRSILKFTPEYTGPGGLIRGLEDTYNWYRQNNTSSPLTDGYVR